MKGQNKNNSGSGSRRNRVRIIAGRWRGRWVEFIDAPGLRPTPDRVRETLFNWLQRDIPGQKVLDLFAGSGVLGLEALSRGAATAVFVDCERRNLEQITQHAKKFGAENFEIIHDDALLWLGQMNCGGEFAGVFVDPPFALNLWAQVQCALLKPGVLQAKAWVYMEMPANQRVPDFSENFSIWRSLRAGEVQVFLLRKLEQQTNQQMSELLSEVPGS